MTVFGELVHLAFRNIARNPRRSGLTGAMVALGVIAILFSRSYIDGLQGLIFEFLVDARDGAMQVQRAGYAASQDLAPLDLDVEERGSMRDRIEAQVASGLVAPRLRFVGFVSNGDTSTMFMGMAIDPERDRKVCPRGPGQKREEVASGRPGLIDGAGLTRIDAAEVVLASELAASLKVKVGDNVTVLVQTKGGSLDALDLSVAGLYRFPDPTENKHTIVVPLATAQRVLHMNGRVTAFVIGGIDRPAIDATRARLAASFADLDPKVEVHTWADLAPYYRDVMKLQNDVLGVVVGIVFVLVVAGVINSMMMSVFERTREIGTLMSLGFRRRRVVALFLCESTLLSATASSVGVVLGSLLIAIAHRRGLVFNIPGVGEILNRPEFSARYAVLACAGACIGGIVGGLLPAVRASRMRPIEALRST